MRDVRDEMKRRECLRAAAAGAAGLVLGTAFEAAAKDQKDKSKAPASSGAVTAASIFVCENCGHVEFEGPPEFCPVCNTEERFKRRGTIFSDAQAELKNGGAKHTPVIRVQEKPTLISDAPCKEVLVRVGEVMHESEKANHIHFIDCYLDGHFFTRFFAGPQMQPAVVLFVRAHATRMKAVSYCTQHGFWQSEVPL